MTFDKEPYNMVVNREKSYLNKIKKNISLTKVKDAKVEYFLSKWKINELGCLKKI